MTQLVTLTQGFMSVVDDEDFETVNNFKWCVQKSGKTNYALRNLRRNGLKTTQSLHIFLLQPAVGMFVDHIDGDGLNNVRSNLRVVTKAQNMQNRNGGCVGSTSNYIGVSYHKGTDKWRARVKAKGLDVSCGLYNTQEEAALARDKAAKEIYGEYARLNFPEVS